MEGAIAYTAWLGIVRTPAIADALGNMSGVNTGSGESKLGGIETGTQLVF